MTLTAPDSGELTPEQRTALETARALIAAGVPVFVAYPDPGSSTGYRLPSEWQRVEPDPAWVDAWRPGMALCAVMGRGLDLIDLDPRNGGSVEGLGDLRPTVLGEALTPSGGVHLFIASLGAGSHDNVLPGVDVKGGLPDGSSRGFAFIAPTVRASKVTGDLGTYRWVSPPAVAPADGSGAALAEKVRAAFGSRMKPSSAGPEWWREFVNNSAPQSARAAEKAIAEKLADVAAWTASSGDGFRTVLMRAALTLGGYVGGGYLAEADAWSRLEQAVAVVWGVPNEDDRRWIAQGIGDGASQPFRVWDGVTVESPWTAELVAPEDPAGPHVVQWVSDPQFMRWLLNELGVRGLTGFLLRGVNLVHCVRLGEHGYVEAGEGDDNGPATVRTATGPTVVAKLALRYLMWRWAGGQKNPYRMEILAPSAAVNAALAALEAAPFLPTLKGVTHTPLVRPDGSLLDRPGWDEQTGYLYSPTVRVPEVPREPTAEQLRVAVELLRGLVDEFTWAGEHDEANFLGLLLTPLLRLVTPPPYKLAAIMAHQPGSGKSLLARVLREVHDGVFRSEMPSDDAELAKVITSVLTCTTAPVVQIDNVSGTLRSSRFAGLLTSAVYSDRVLGSTNSVEMANDRLWCITGNNLSLGGDLVRRTLWVTIDPGVPNPEQRTGFRISDLGAHVRRERGAILAALLTLVRAWVAAGSPTEVRSSDDYARWSSVVRGILAVAGVPGEFDHAESAQQTASSDDDGWGEFLTAVFGVFGEAPWTVADVLAKVSDPRATFGLGVTGNESRPIPLDALPAELMEKWHRGTAGKSLGRWLMNRQGRWVGGLSARSAGRDRANKVLWRVTSYTGRNQANQTDHLFGDEQGHKGAGFVGFAGFGSNISQEKNELFTGKELERNPANPTNPAGPPAQHSATPETAGQPASEPNPAPQPKPKKRENPDKAAERAAAKEQARQDAIAAAAGEVLALPAVVDREGHAIPVTVEQAAAVVRTAMARSGALDVDVETTGYPLGHRHYGLRTVQLGDHRAAAVFDPIAHAETIRVLLAEAPTLGAFSATADLIPLAHAGLGDAEELWARMHDTVLVAKLADPTSTGAAADGLKPLALGVLGATSVAPAADTARDELFKAGKWLKTVKVDTEPQRSGWASVDPACATMLRYAASDVLDTAAVRRALPAPDPAVFERERLAQRMTARVTHHGMRIDAEHVARLTAEHTGARDAATAAIRAFGVDNPGSDAQVGQTALSLGAALPQTPTGRPSVAASVLEALRGSEGALGEFVRAVLEHRHHDTVLGTFLGPYAELCRHGDGRARPTVYTLGTDTGRMSCVRPNLQQLPRAGGVRACITADPGHVLISADFSGVELRVAAALSGDPTLRQIIADERDLHMEIARQVYGPDAGKAQRYVAKRIVFGRLYGGGIATLAAQAGVTPDVAQSAVDVLDALTPQLAAWSAGMREAVRAGNTRLPTYAGRAIHLPREYPHKAPNYAIQGTARELLVDALVRWADTRWGRAVLIPVHDELIVHVPEEDGEEATAALVAAMTGDLYGVPIVVEADAPSFAWLDSE